MLKKISGRKTFFIIVVMFNVFHFNMHSYAGELKESKKKWTPREIAEEYEFQAFNDFEIKEDKLNKSAAEVVEALVGQLGMPEVAIVEKLAESGRLLVREEKQQVILRDRANEIVSAYLAGEKIPAIAKEFELDPVILKYFLIINEDETDVQYLRQDNNMSTIYTDHIIFEYLRDKKNSKIARDFELNGKTVSDFLKTHDKQIVSLKGLYKKRFQIRQEFQDPNIKITVAKLAKKYNAENEQIQDVLALAGSFLGNSDEMDPVIPEYYKGTSPTALANRFHIDPKKMRRYTWMLDAACNLEGLLDNEDEQETEHKKGSKLLYTDIAQAGAMTSRLKEMAPQMIDEFNKGMKFEQIALKHGIPKPYVARAFATQGLASQELIDFVHANYAKLADPRKSSSDLMGELKKPHLAFILTARALVSSNRQPFERIQKNKCIEKKRKRSEWENEAEVQDDDAPNIVDDYFNLSLGELAQQYGKNEKEIEDILARKGILHLTEQSMKILIEKSDEIFSSLEKKGIPETAKEFKLTENDLNRISRTNQEYAIRQTKKPRTENAKLTEQTLPKILEALKNTPRYKVEEHCGATKTSFGSFLAENGYLRESSLKIAFKYGDYLMRQKFVRKKARDWLKSKNVEIALNDVISIMIAKESNKPLRRVQFLNAN